VSLFAVNLAIFVLFFYLCYTAWHDVIGKDEDPQRKSLDQAAEVKSTSQNEEWVECLNPVVNVGIHMDKLDGEVELEMDEFEACDSEIPTFGRDQESTERGIFANG